LQPELLSQAIRRGQNANNMPVGAKDFLLCFEAFMTNQVDNGAYVLPFEELRMQDVEIVGGKNASLGEMISSWPRPACACPAVLPPPRSHSATSSNTTT
jgi:hypothetical protein